ncbi:hypothetical protein BG005_007141 [Podila minutissima]|nr:hypothetical protein BG005_007141 [Podila minutissima]
MAPEYRQGHCVQAYSKGHDNPAKQGPSNQHSNNGHNGHHHHHHHHSSNGSLGGQQSQSNIKNTTQGQDTHDVNTNKDSGQQQPTMAPSRQTWPLESSPFPHPSLNTAAPLDGSFNLYVRGLSRDTSVQTLFRLFEPYGEIISCKPMLDIRSGYCRGDGFVRFANEEGFRTARRELTQRGYYVSVAHETATMKHLVTMERPQHASNSVAPEAGDLFDIGDTQEFPSLPPRKKGHRQAHPLPPQSDPLPSKLNKEQPKTPKKESRPQTPVINTSLDAQGQMAEEVEFEAPWASQDAQATDNTAQAPESEGLTFPFSPTYFEFATDRYGPYDGLSNALPNLNMFGQPSSFFQSKDNRNPSIDDIDNYMSHLPSILGYGGMHEHRSSSNDLLIENQRVQQAVLFFENLPDGETYLELFERCSQYGPLVLTSVDIRYINEDCHGQGKVSFSTSDDSEIALRSLTDAGYNVTREISEPSIDMDLYDQLNRQHPDALDTTFVSYHQDEISTVDRWGYDSTPQLGNGHMNRGNLFDSAAGQEKQFMFGISPLPASLSPASSSTVSLPNSHDWGDQPASRDELPGQPQESEPEQSTQKKDQDEELTPKAPPKPLSYSDMVKVPPKPIPKPPEPKSPIQSEAEDYDMKRRGNTNKSLDKNEYRLNLYLKNLESSMDDCQLYKMCVQFGDVMSCRVITNNRGECTGLGFVMYLRNSSVTDALKGLKELGYQAEVAVPSATNKLRCKEMSDMLFLQNIPEVITENKLRDLFKPFTVMNCHILRDPRTGKGRGVAFLKMRDIYVAERFIETFHGRVLGPDWRLPLQVSPARRNNSYNHS